MQYGGRLTAVAPDFVARTVGQIAPFCVRFALGLREYIPGDFGVGTTHVVFPQHRVGAAREARGWGVSFYVRKAGELAWLRAMTDGLIPKPYFSLEDLEPEFRVVVRGENRRGVRMEHRFWAMLKGLAESRKSTLGQVVEEISRLHPDSRNLTSAIRVACALWLSDENKELRRVASLMALDSVLHACPSPALVLSSSRTILTSNPAFHQLVRRKLVGERAIDFRDQLKIGLDISVPEISSRLERNDGPIVTGFVVTAEDKLYRAQLNMVKAPTSEPGLLLAFVASG